MVCFTSLSYASVLRMVRGTVTLDVWADEIEVRVARKKVHIWYRDIMKELEFDHSSSGLEQVYSLHLS